ncbi:FkbM family methyltransferase [Erythrobacter crassostreae]|uniref:FkbM family methyltransferase n=1 Tax=Erythrobacter crassostreae TaxID=2828328 RepID=A0A9X1JPX5_9SPHN|nr:FkbM family methyltransferase [Erythrobacter crassostrea]MBV7259897.1 FkbM family methyltransferase [Erythrobacter crassostrea]
MNRLEPAGSFRSAWPEHDPKRMARDFLLWRHLRVVRARTMRHIRGLLGGGRSTPVTTTYGVKMWSNWGDKTYAYCHYGTYGSYLADLLASVREPFCFVDIGANQGLFSLVAGQNASCAKIIALEPVGPTYERLVANLSANELDERSEALNFGLSDKVGEFPITLSKGHSGLATLGDHGMQLSREHTQASVRLQTMDALAGHLPEYLPIFVKIDVEGHEETVIRELLQSPHAKRIIAIFYEHDDRWTDKGAVNALLDDAGFEHSRIYGRGKHYDVLATPLGV